jgi:GNAT superfamily N-acetyltransferase
LRVRKEQVIPYGLPNISFIGYPLSIPCAGHAGLGFREASRCDTPALVDHLTRLSPHDRRMRFCATLTDAAIERHVEGIWQRRAVVLAAHDGPLWDGPLHRAGPIRAAVELALDDREAELGISVDPALRRRGVGTYLVQTAGMLLRARGLARVRAYTMPGNASFLGLARACGGLVEAGPDEVEVSFDVAALARAYVARRTADAFAGAA